MFIPFSSTMLEALASCVSLGCASPLNSATLLNISQLNMNMKLEILIKIKIILII